MNKTLMMAFCAAELLMGTSVVMAQTPEMIASPTQRVMENRSHEFKGRYPNMMQDRLAEELKLTDEQKAELQKVRDENREKIKPLMEQMKELRKQMDDLRKADMESFETILTPEQKKIFEEVKAKRHTSMKQRMEKFRKDMEMRPNSHAEKEIEKRIEKESEVLPPSPTAE